LKKLQPIQDIEEGFVAYSEGKAVIPPVGEMLFKKPPGDVHIKYGYIAVQDIQIAKAVYHALTDENKSQASHEGT